MQSKGKLLVITNEKIGNKLDIFYDKILENLAETYSVYLLCSSADSFMVEEKFLEKVINDNVSNLGKYLDEINPEYILPIISDENILNSLKDIINKNDIKLLEVKNQNNIQILEKISQSIYKDKNIEYHSNHTNFNTDEIGMKSNRTNVDTAEIGMKSNRTNVDTAEIGMKSNRTNVDTAEIDMKNNQASFDIKKIYIDNNQEHLNEEGSINQKREIDLNNLFQLLGTNFESLLLLNDKRKLKEKLNQKNNVKLISKEIATNENTAYEIVNKMGLPVKIKAIYPISNYDVEIIKNEEDVKNIINKMLSISKIHEVEIEKDFSQSKNVEFVFLSDNIGNCLVISNKETIYKNKEKNLSVSPIQTLSDYLYQNVRKEGIEIIRKLNLIGLTKISFYIEEKQIIVASIENGFFDLADNFIFYEGVKIDKAVSDVIQNKKLSDISEPLYREYSYKNVYMIEDNSKIVVADSVQKAFVKLFETEEIFYKENEEEKTRFDKLIKNIETNEKEFFYLVYLAIKKGIELNALEDISKIDMFYLKALKEIIDYKSSNNSKATENVISNNENKKIVLFVSNKEEFNTSSKIYFLNNFMKALKSLGYYIVVVSNNINVLNISRKNSDKSYIENPNEETIKDILHNEKNSIVVPIGNFDEPCIKKIKDLSKKMIILREDFDNEEIIRIMYISKEKQGKKHCLEIESIQNSFINKIEQISGVNEKKTANEAILKKDIPQETEIKKEINITKKITESKEIEEVKYKFKKSGKTDIKFAKTIILYDKKKILIPGIIEKGENDTHIYPLKEIEFQIKEVILNYCTEIMKEVNKKGLYNVEFVINDRDIEIININNNLYDENIALLSKASDLDIIQTFTDLVIEEKKLNKVSD